MMDFRMDTFITVCKYMNYSKAANDLSITQPAVSKHMKYLEEYYNVKLFLYEGKKMFLTEAGKLLYQTAITMKHDDQYLKESLITSDNNKKTLRFGATLTIGEFVISSYLKKYLYQYTDTDISLVIGNTSELIDKLRDGLIDFAFVEGNFEKSEFEYLIFSQERFIPVCCNHHLFSKMPHKLKDLLTERIIVRELGSGTREIFEKNLEARNISVNDFRNVIEIGGMNAIKSLVLADCGITFLYEAVVKHEIERNELKEIVLEDFHVFHEFSFIWNKGSAFSKNFREVYEVLKGEN